MSFMAVTMFLKLVTMMKMMMGNNVTVLTMMVSHDNSIYSDDFESCCSLRNPMQTLCGGV